MSKQWSKTDAFMYTCYCFSHVEETGVSCHTFRSSEYSHGGLFLKLDFIINAWLQT